MKNRNVLALLLIVLGALAVVAQEEYSVNAVKATGDITVDGELDEACYGTATKVTIEPGFFTTKVGDADGPEDLSGDFVAAYDDNGFVVALWFRDDLHFAPNCVDKTTVTSAWMDDGHEFWITPDYYDAAFADDVTPYFGQWGSQYEVGYNYSGTADNKFVAVNKETDGIAVNTGYTVEEAKENFGFEWAYTSDDGINFNAEAFWSWTGDAMNNVGAPVAGDGYSIGFNLGINDNDGSATFDCCMRWTGYSTHSDLNGWGVVVVGTPGIAPSSNVTSIVKNNVKIDGMYDIQGRRISGNIPSVKGVFFSTVKNNKMNVEKRINLR